MINHQRYHKRFFHFQVSFLFPTESVERKTPTVYWPKLFPTWKCIKHEALWVLNAPKHILRSESFHELFNRYARAFTIFLNLFMFFLEIKRKKRKKVFHCWSFPFICARKLFREFRNAKLTSKKKNYWSLNILTFQKWNV